MAIYELVMHSAEETMEFAVRLSEQLQPKDVIALEGDLGAGKTTFTKGLAKGLGITRAVSSPTFMIVKEYKGRLPLYHMDVYRLEDTFEDLGFDEYFEGDGVTVIEWAHLIKPQLPDELLYIHLYHHGDQERKMVLEPIGKRYEQLCKEIIEG
ncbi:tRNA (adenosine(37)-N6)-threonylcarbamoyltransferase complex ATPase subunit type 1 TsaE [Anoxybacteroides rupiense]|uniref:tRNA (adenosine(37)-N6)-threonylcarbamoyltransferase complex ATPase subunit type 1 TsaE n=1 Tax=Anoxybacteroides rupiense TaxID=311460 RepID=UPI001F08F4DD|nr:tRNA (adenosine(37)-N6)-threonylcarbamoyltransferase complex ATPase subunit type 1 TsaE [Anoxybacillus rupiensis]